MEEKVAEKLWDWAVKQDQHVLDEFGIAIVGIGALFFAYGTFQTISVKLIVASIGLATSLILWNDMSYAVAEYDAVMKLLDESTVPLVKVLRRAQGASTFPGKWYQKRPTLVMSSFMPLVAWAWAVIILYRVFYWVIHGPGVSIRAPTRILDSALSVLVWLSIFFVLWVLIRLFLRKRGKVSMSQRELTDF